MAKNQKKIDPTEAALSAIQEALEVREQKPAAPAAKESPEPVSNAAPEFVADIRRKPTRNGVATVDENLFVEQPASRAIPRNERSEEAPALRRPAANDDRHSIGQILQAVQRRPSRMSYTLATIFSIAWIVGGVGLASIYMGRLEVIMAQDQSAIPLLIALGALFVLPVFFFFALAHMVSRSHELRMIAQSMAEVAIRLAEPETVARESIVSVGQAIRREVAAMGDGVERALARAAELEALVHNEVSALERAYNDNEVRIRGMLQDLSSQRDTLFIQAEQVRNAISSVHLDLSQDINAFSDLVAERVSETAQRITHTLADKGEHITLALGRAGDSMISALTERGGDLLERLENTSEQTTHAISTAGDRMMASLNFRTSSIHEEFNQLASSLLHSVNTQLSDVAQSFEQRSNAMVDMMGSRTQQMAASIIDSSTRIADTITSRAEEVNSTLKATGDSLVLDLSLRGGDIVANLAQTGKTITDTLSNHGSDIISNFQQTGTRVTEALVAQGGQVTQTLHANGDDLARAVDAKGEAVKNMLASRLLAFEEMFSHGGTELGEKITRESTTLGNLITRHLSEFDRTVKTYGGELVERLGKRTDEVADAIRTYVDGFDGRVKTHAEEIGQVLDRRLVSLEESLAGRGRAMDQSLETWLSDIANVISTRDDNVAATLASKIDDIDRTLRAGALEVASNLDGRISKIEDLNTSIQTHAGDAERSLTSLSASISSTLKDNVADAERTLLGVSAEVARKFTSKADEIAAAVSARANEMTAVLDQGSTGLLSALTHKSEEFASQVGRATEHALTEIDMKGSAFAQALNNQSSEITRGINEASVNATIAVTRTLQDLQETSQSAIEQSKQTATAAVSEMLETQGMLRSDTTTLFERLREANILLQEVLSGAHENMSSLENTMVVRVSEFVASMNAVREQSGAATSKVDEQIGKFASVTTRVLGDLSELAVQFENHGRGLAEAVQLIDHSNRRTEEALGERRVGLDSLVSTLDIRTEDLEQRLKRFTGLLDETLDSASGRAREIVSIVSEAGTGGAQAVVDQFEIIRATVDQERGRTAEAMRGIYEDARNDTTAIFRQSTERFTEVIHGMKHMASEMQRELEATHTELRRGILELPQETAESAAQMRRVIVDQIEALAELNRIVARHGGRGVDVAEPARRTATANHREDSMAGGLERERPEAPRPAPRREAPSRDAISREFGTRDTSSSRELPGVSLSGSSSPSPSRRPEAPALSPAAGNGNRASGWLSDLLQRASRDEEPMAEAPREPAPREIGRDERTAAHSIESLDSLSVDIARMIDHNAATELWDRYKRGERNVFTRRLYTLQGQKAFDDISKKYRADREFRQTVDRYITEFERLLDEVSRDDRGQVVARTYLTSETGKVYTMLAHASGRFE